MGAGQCLVLNRLSDSSCWGYSPEGGDSGEPMMYTLTAPVLINAWPAHVRGAH